MTITLKLIASAALTLILAAGVPLTTSTFAASCNSNNCVKPKTVKLLNKKKSKTVNLSVQKKKTVNLSSKKGKPSSKPKTISLGTKKTVKTKPVTKAQNGQIINNQSMTYAIQQNNKSHIAHQAKQVKQATQYKQIQLVGPANAGRPNLFSGTNSNQQKLLKLGTGTAGTKTSPFKAAGSGCKSTKFGSCSDIRLKRDIVPLVRLDNGIELYRFRYAWSDQRYVGVMAQEVSDVVPAAVSRGRDGYLRVNYTCLGLRLHTWEEWKATHSSP